MKVFLLLCISFSLSTIILQAQPNPCNSPQAGLDCESAPVLCDINSLNGYCTTLPDFANPTGPSPLCATNGGGVPNNTIWFGFVAGSSFISLNFIPANCNGTQPGIQGGIYSGDCSNITPVVCQGVCSNSPMNLSSNTFIPGQVYWVAIDGCNGSVCDITIDLISGTSMPTLGPIGAISGPQKICKNSTVSYSVPKVLAAEYYLWTLDGIELGDPVVLDNTISVTLNSPGVHHLCLDVANYCIDAGQLPVAKC
ncbi:MAG TPA: hypothetical protein VK590_03085, partial [Saprospiraceae bacterium]|nr:hypothetical protein [Saprospiraceae bacterium]